MFVNPSLVFILVMVTSSATIKTKMFLIETADNNFYIIDSRNQNLAEEFRDSTEKESGNDEFEDDSRTEENIADKLDVDEEHEGGRRKADEIANDDTDRDEKEPANGSTLDDHSNDEM